MLAQSKQVVDVKPLKHRITSNFLHHNDTYDVIFQFFGWYSNQPMKTNFTHSQSKN